MLSPWCFIYTLYIVQHHYQDIKIGYVFMLYTLIYTISGLLLFSYALFLWKGTKNSDAPSTYTAHNMRLFLSSLFLAKLPYLPDAKRYCKSGFTLANARFADELSGVLVPLFYLFGLPASTLGEITVIFLVSGIMSDISLVLRNHFVDKIISALTNTTAQSDKKSEVLVYYIRIIFTVQFFSLVIGFALSPVIFHFYSYDLFPNFWFLLVYSLLFFVTWALSFTRSICINYEETESAVARVQMIRLIVSLLLIPAGYYVFQIYGALIAISRSSMVATWYQAYILKKKLNLSLLKVF